jgi:hypothetical protein
VFIFAIALVLVFQIGGAMRAKALAKKN